MGRYVDTDYDKCIGCHICADVCPTGYIKMAWRIVNNLLGNNFWREISVPTYKKPTICAICTIL